MGNCRWGTATAAFMLFLLFLAPAWAAQDGQKPPELIFPQLFPRPSGQNGYEELVAAVDLIALSKPAGEAQNPGATLAIKRAALDDPPVRRAMQLIRTGLAKAVLPPRTKLDLNTRFPELAGFRSLARMLNVQAYVLLADGRVGAAIDAMQNGLRLGYVVQKQTLIAGLVGIAIDGIVLNQMAQHLDQLSVRDCDRLIGLGRDWLKLPDPAPDLIGADQDAVMRILDQARTDPQGFMDAMGWSHELKDQANQFLANLTRQDPRAIDKLAAQLATVLVARRAAYQAELHMPYYQRTPVPPVPRDTLIGMLFDQMGVEPLYDKASTTFVKDQAQVQLLAVHAAIRKYRWEHETWPPSLGELRLGALAVDPFTGQPLLYRLTGATYELSAAGAMDRSAGTGEQPQRTPVYLPKRD